MTALPTTGEQALAPVRDFLIRRAENDAATVRTQATERAAATVEAARSRAMAIVARGRAEGAGEAARVVRIELVRSRRQARAEVLAAKRELYDEVLRRSRAAGRTLRDAPNYPRLLEALRQHATDVLGPDATVTESPEGGVVGVAGTRRLDLTLPRLAEGAVERLGAEVRQLWQV